MSTHYEIGHNQGCYNALAPLFGELVGKGIDSPLAIAVELNRRGVPRLNRAKWCGRSVSRAVRRVAPELAEIVRRAGRRYRPANLEQAWQATRQRVAAHAARLLPVLSELIAAGVRSPHALAQELNRRGLPGVNGGKWSTRTIIQAIRRGAPELAEDLSSVGNRGRGVNVAALRANREHARRATQQLANAHASRLLPVFQELIAKGFTPDLMATELNSRGMRGRYGKKWRSSTVRKVVERADPELYAKWSAWCTGRVVRRDLRADRERGRNNLERLRRQAADYRQEIVRIVEPLIAAGHDSASKLVAELARLGVPTARGGRWRPETVLKMLKSEQPGLHRTIRLRSPPERGERFAARLRPIIDHIIAQGINQPSAIAGELDRRQIPTRRGGPAWHRNSVRALLRQFGHLGPSKRRYRSLSASDLARQLGVQEDEIYAAVRNGHLVGVASGRSISFPPDVIERTLYARSRRDRS